MTMVIPDEIINTTHMSAWEIMAELSIILFQKEKLTLKQAADLAGVNRIQFQHLLAARMIPVHYDIGDLEDDLRNLKSLNLL